jgi:multisubunit Na+/H+ antiporter MnhF subunit
MVAPARSDLRHARRMKPVALVLLAAQLVISLAMLPDSPFAHLAEPTYLAALASIAITLLLAITRFVARPPWLDRLVLATFLIAMPLIYAWCAILRGDNSDLALESIGILVYGGAALAGYLRWPWLIGAGIIAHGLGWDLWHHGRSSYVPDWYSAACLVVDLGIGGFALVYLQRAGKADPISQRDALPRSA